MARRPDQRARRQLAAAAVGDVVSARDWTTGEREAALDDWVGDLTDDDQHPTPDEVAP